MSSRERRSCEAKLLNTNVIGVDAIAVVKNISQSAGRSDRETGDKSL